MPAAREAWTEERSNFDPTSLLSESELSRIVPIVRTARIRYAFTSRLRPNLAWNIHRGAYYVNLVTCFILALGAVFTSRNSISAEDIVPQLVAILLMLMLVTLILRMTKRPDFIWCYNNVFIPLIFSCISISFMINPLSLNNGPIMIGFITASLTVFTVVFFSWDILFNYWYMPKRLVLVGAMPRCHLAALELWMVAEYMAEARKTCLQTSSKMSLLDTIYTVRRTLKIMSRSTIGPKEIQRALGSDAGKQFLQVESYLHELSKRVTTCGTRAEYSAILEDMKRTVLAISSNDWSSLPEVAPVSRVSKFRQFGRKFSTIALLVAAAVSVPYVPFVNIEGNAAATMQVALLVSAILALIPAEGDAKRQILGMFQGPSRNLSNQGDR